MNYGTSYNDTRASLNSGPSPALGFTFNWYAFSAINITGLTGNGCIYFATWYLCPYQSAYKTGSIFYRNASSSDLSQISTSVTQTYSTSFTATNAFIVTYYNAVDSYGRSNTFQAVLVTDGTHSYVIYNFGTCQTRNARSFVQNGTYTYIMWDNTAAYYLSYSAYMYDYFNYDQNTPAQQTNACKNGQFVYSYPKQTVSCASSGLAWSAVYVIIVCVVLFVCTIVAIIVIVLVICLLKKKKADSGGRVLLNNNDEQPLQQQQRQQPQQSQQSQQYEQPPNDKLNKRGKVENSQIPMTSYSQQQQQGNLYPDVPQTGNVRRQPTMLQPLQHQFQTNGPELTFSHQNRDPNLTPVSKV
jgi:hypothetical protein